MHAKIEYLENSVGVLVLVQAKFLSLVETEAVFIVRISSVLRGIGLCSILVGLRM